MSYKQKLITAATAALATAALYTMSPQAKDRLTLFEGEVLESYADTGNIYTIGVGHASQYVLPNMQITKEESQLLLASDIAKSSRVIEKYVKVELTQSQVDSLLHFIHNFGSGNFSKSTLLKKINANECEQAGKEFLRWNKIKKWDKKQQKYVMTISSWQNKRRAWESEQWLKGCKNDS